MPGCRETDAFWFKARNQFVYSFHRTGLMGEEPKQGTRGCSVRKVMDRKKSIRFLKGSELFCIFSPLGANERPGKKKFPKGNGAKLHGSREGDLFF